MVAEERREREERDYNPRRKYQQSNFPTEKKLPQAVSQRYREQGCPRWKRQVIARLERTSESLEVEKCDDCKTRACRRTKFREFANKIAPINRVPHATPNARPANAVPYRGRGSVSSSTEANNPSVKYGSDRKP